MLWCFIIGVSEQLGDEGAGEGEGWVAQLVDIKVASFCVLTKI